MPKGKRTYEYEGRKYTADDIADITGFGIHWVYRQLQRVKQKKLTLKALMTTRKEERNFFIGADGTKYTIDYLLRKYPSMELQVATQRIMRARCGQIDEKGLLVPPKKQSEMYHQPYAGVHEDLTPEQAKTMAEMTDQIHSSIDKMDRYYPPKYYFEEKT